MLHAIALTLVRLLVTQRRLLEWETAAAASARAAGLMGEKGLRVFGVGDGGEPAPALLLLVLVALVRPEALVTAAPFLLLWLAAPAVAFGLSRP